MDHTTLTEAKLATPAVGINALILLGLSPADWLMVLNFTYVGLLLAHKLWTMWKEYRGS